MKTKLDKTIQRMTRRDTTGLVLWGCYILLWSHHPIIISKISVVVCMSKYAHTHPQRYLRKHDRVVGPKRKGNKNNKAAKKTAQRQGKAADKTRQDKIRQDKTKQDKTRKNDIHNYELLFSRRIHSHNFLFNHLSSDLHTKHLDGTTISLHNTKPSQPK